MSDQPNAPAPHSFEPAIREQPPASAGAPSSHAQVQVVEDVARDTWEEYTALVDFTTKQTAADGTHRYTVETVEFVGRAGGLLDFSKYVEGRIRHWIRSRFENRKSFGTPDPMQGQRRFRSRMFIRPTMITLKPTMSALPTP